MKTQRKSINFVPMCLKYERCSVNIYESFKLPFKNIICGITLSSGEDYKDHTVASQYLSGHAFSRRLPPVIMEQVHGSKVKVIRNVRDFPLPGEAAQGVDGVIFEKYFKDIAVGVRVADCMPVFVFTDNRLSAFMHVGWRGLKKELPLKIAATLRKNREIFVYVGPHICAKCFTVSGSVRDIFRVSETVNLFLELKDQLRKAGIRKENIKLLKRNNYCTYENKKYFSHRRGNPRRMIAFVIQH